MTVKLGTGATCKINNQLGLSNQPVEDRTYVFKHVPNPPLKALNPTRDHIRARAKHLAPIWAQHERITLKDNPHPREI